MAVWKRFPCIYALDFNFSLTRLVLEPSEDQFLRHVTVLDEMLPSINCSGHLAIRHVIVTMHDCIAKKIAISGYLYDFWR